MARQRFIFFDHGFSFLIFLIVSSQFSAVSATEQSFLDRPENLYQNGQFSKAADLWLQAAGDFKIKGDALNEAQALSNLAVAFQQLGRYSEASEALTSSLNILTDLDSNEAKLALARSLNAQGNLQFSTGQPEAAIKSWQKAAQAYKEIDDKAGVSLTLINQAQAMQSLGFWRQSLETLREVNKNLEPQPDSVVKASALRSLGNSLRMMGNFDESEKVLLHCLAISQKLDYAPAISETLLNLGNTAWAKQDYQNAVSYYQQAALDTSTPTIQLQAKVNQFTLLVKQQEFKKAENLIEPLKALLNNLQPSRKTVYAHINFAQSLVKLNRDKGQKSYEGPARLLATAIQQAQSLKDTRAETYGLGNLAAIYEQAKQWKDAEKLTQQALQLAHTINAPDIAYRWQWQLGRILRSQGNKNAAISAYRESINSLVSIRTDIVVSTQDVQFSFRESVEPIYRQLVALLLEENQPTQTHLELARQTIESLQLAELDNFFRNACLVARPVEIDKLDPTAAVLYPIILEDRISVILSIPGQPLRYYSTPIPQKDVDLTIWEFRQSLVTQSSRRYLPVGKKLYEWLIQPAEQDLAKNNIKTLVFILDGGLRNVPMSALYDGREFLLEKYALALTPGLQLLDVKTMPRDELKALTAGLTESRQGLSALPNVAQEVAQIQLKLGTKLLLNADFTTTNLQKEVSEKSFAVVHIATHGEFSSRAEDTFILSWDSKINIYELQDILRSRNKTNLQNNAIELLVLSACKTAFGDNRAALGLAGVAVRAGARSTLASLWYISDAATAPLMTEFYREYTNSKITKSEALRRAQVALMHDSKYNHPIYWAPYVLVGNWL